VGRSRIADQLRANGLSLQSCISGQADVNMPFKAMNYSDNPAILQQGVDFVIVCVKCDSNNDIIRTLSALPRHVPIMSLQNGVNNVQRMKEALPSHNILGAVIVYNVLELGNGCFRRTSSGAIALDERVGSEITNIFTRSHVGPIKLLSAANLQAFMYGKLLINLGNALNALSGVPVPIYLSDALYRSVLAAAIAEALSVYRAANITSMAALPLPIPNRWVPYLLQLPNLLYRRIAGASIRIDARSKSSMLQDLERRRSSTEIQDLNGMIVSLGKQHTVPTPVNTWIVKRIEDAVRLSKGSPCLSGPELVQAVKRDYPELGQKCARVWNSVIVVAFILFIVTARWILRWLR